MNNYDWESFLRNAKRFFSSYMPYLILLGILLLVGTFLGPIIGIVVVLGAIVGIVWLSIDFFRRGF